MRRVRRKSSTGQTVQPEPADGEDPSTVTVAMIQALIPLGLRAVEEALQAEVAALAGPRYAREAGPSAVVRWGAQRGSVYLADQKLPIEVPRVRDRAAGAELPLATYAALQTPRGHDVGLFRRVLGGLSCREYEAAAEAVPEAFGLARTSVSRRFIRASARELQRLQERRLDDAEWLVLVLDGKTFAGDQLVVALGVTATGEKRILGLVQTASENRRVLASFLRELGERGFPLDQPLLAVLDGAKGLRAAVREVFGDDPGAALSVAQAGECRESSRQARAADVAAETAGRVRAAELRGGETGAHPAPARTPAPERLRRGEPGRRAGGDAHAAPARRRRRTQRELQDDEPDRERDGAARSEDAPRDPLAHE